MYKEEDREEEEMVVVVEEEEEEEVVVVVVVGVWGGRKIDYCCPDFDLYLHEYSTTIPGTRSYRSSAILGSSVLYLTRLQ